MIALLLYGLLGGWLPRCPWGVDAWVWQRRWWITSRFHVQMVIRWYGSLAERREPGWYVVRPCRAVPMLTFHRDTRLSFMRVYATREPRRVR